MYSHCLDYTDCPLNDGCMTIGGAGTNGYCTDTTCPTCVPAPGVAPVICITVTGYSLCALDCSAGQTCPTGMVCDTAITDTGDQLVCF
jgi:hypothetical protein